MRVRRAVRRLRGERGQVALEFMGMLPLLLLVALLVWQLLLAGYTVISAENAARTASRVDGRGGDPEKAAKASLTLGLDRHAKVRMAGEKATVRVRMPIVAPGFSSRRFTAERSAELPQ